MNTIKRREIIAGLNKPRSGWVIRGISEKVAETVKQHTKKIVRAAKIYATIKPSLGRVRLVKMAMYHDIAEYKEKDYLPGEITLEEKHQRELAVLEFLRDRFERGREIYEMWCEYEARETIEAVSAKQLDIMDTGIQAFQYYQDGYNNVRDFFPWMEKKLEDPLLVKIWDILCYSEFDHLPLFEQYFLLLELGGDRAQFQQIMRSMNIS